MVTERVEIWREIPGTDGYYSASSLGRIRSESVTEMRGGRPYRRRGRILRQSPHSGGYLTVGGGSNLPSRFVHRLVAMAFYPDGDFSLEVNHKDGGKKNNRPDNLEWATRSENQMHSFRVLGQQQVNKIAVTLRRSGFARSFDSITDAANFCGARVSSVSRALKKGHRWRGWTVASQ